MRTWMKLAAAVLLAVPFTSSSLRADAETNDEKIKKLQTEIAELRKELRDLKEDVKTSSVRGLRVAQDLDDIKRILREIERQPPIARESGYGPGSLLPGGPIPTTGRIVLENVYSAPATVNINGQSYFVEPNRTRIVPNFPVGPFQYSVNVDGFGMVEPPHTDTLQAAGYRIRIFPRIP